MVTLLVDDLHVTEYVFRIPRASERTDARLDFARPFVREIKIDFTSNERRPSLVAGQIRRAEERKDEIEPVGRSTEPVTTDGAHDPVSFARRNTDVTIETLLGAKACTVGKQIFCCKMFIERINTNRARTGSH
ncbi:uncharacterized protein LOC143148403 [Ptiloglossa arizonensis]|uniref:uncharacterized protein LOC143148403 n=1 Tax=Ptiloglossa arizonensis TaxID=3350558 RepID=UPI003FA08EFA